LYRVAHKLDRYAYGTKNQDHAYAWSRTRKCGWATAQKLILGTTITLKRLKTRGYQSLTDVYLELNPSFCEPPYIYPN